MGEELARIIREEIRAKGPMPFSRWMELCLYHPAHGYYMGPGRKTGYGRDADFVTPPTLHPFLAQAVAAEVAASWEASGRLTPFVVVEHGGGEGDLARDALAEVDRRWPALGQAIEWRWSERSPRHAAAQVGRDRRIQPAGNEPFRRHFWVLVEVVDALPVDVARRAGDGWLQLHVALAREGFGAAWLPATEAPKDFGAVAALLGQARQQGARNVGEVLDAAQAVDSRAFEPRDVPEGAHVLLQARREWFLDGMAEFMAGGIVVDYGASASRLRRMDDGLATVRAFRGHRLVDDVLADPGDADLTASVDFSLVAAKALQHGFACGPAESLEAFLLRHGILEALNAVDRSTPEGASSYLRLRQLLLPTGMGAAFKVMRFGRTPPTAPT